MQFEFTITVKKEDFELQGAEPPKTQEELDKFASILKDVISSDEHCWPLLFTIALDLWNNKPK